MSDWNLEKSFLDNGGYIRMYQWKNGRSISIQQHDFIWESVNGKRPKGMVIHHINGIKTDNRIENLQLLTNGEHTKLHHTGVKRIYKGKRYSYRGAYKKDNKKICTECKLLKERYEYHRDGNYVMSKCKLCKSKISKEKRLMLKINNI